MTITFLLFIVILPIGYFSFEGSISEPSENRISNSSTSERRDRNNFLPDGVRGIMVKITNSVDLGFSSGTLWADMNLGARFVGDYGDLYSWGEIETKGDYRQSCYTGINAMSIIGTECDVATKILGADWLLPSQAQFDELVRECLWEWKDMAFLLLVKMAIQFFFQSQDGLVALL